ncbi:MAG: choice-of-anchor V domain-containing protein [Ignavibacteriaceae bacterium]
MIPRPKYIFSITFGFLIIAGSTILLYAYSNGITGKTLKNGNGCTCHNASPSQNVFVTISGPDTLIAGKTGTYTITIKGGPLVRAGTDIAASAGTLSPQGTDLRLDTGDGELTHVLPKAPLGIAVTFSFLYTAPNTAGNVTLYANGNSVNFNGIADPGDMWNFAPNKIITVNSTISGITNRNRPSGFHLNQNYPNPFNPSTIISFLIPDPGYVKLEVFNVLGLKIKTLVNEFKSAGNYSYDFNAVSFASGIYYYRLSTGSFSEVKKMLLLK